MLEWFQATRRNTVLAGVTVSTILVLYMIIEDSGFGWMGTWWLWLLIVPWPIYFYFAARDRMSAGADWYKYGRRYVKIYELTSIKVKGTGGAAWDLDLEDSGGRKVTTQLWRIQQNPRLWDLVYNGIRHSVCNGAETNRRALDRLQLG